MSACPSGRTRGPQDGKGATRRIVRAGAGFHGDPKWSPDSENLSFTDNPRTISIVDVATGTQTSVASDPFYGPGRGLHQAWSPDSRPFAYTHTTPTCFSRLFVQSVADGQSLPVSDGLAKATSPVFDAVGKCVYVLV